MPEIAEYVSHTMRQPSPMTIRTLDRQDLVEWLKAHGQPAFRAKQIDEWLNQKLATSFDDMKNLPAKLRQELAQDFTCLSLETVQKHVSADHTVKWLLRLEDGNTIETVLIRTRDRETVCVSTQVGCPVRCAFCASGQSGFVRNLSPEEIIDQVILASGEAGRRVTNIVVMGMGEPLVNFDSLVQALDFICRPEGLGLGARHVTISTSGFPDRIRKLADLQRPWNLALSLHAVDDRTRARLIPTAKHTKIADLLEAMTYYRTMTGRMVTLEYILIEGINATRDDARALAEIAHNLHAKVNLIPSNTDDPRFPPPSPEKSMQFCDILTRKNVQATLRLRKGKDIEAACGQLRRRNQKTQER